MIVPPAQPSVQSKFTLSYVTLMFIKRKAVNFIILFKVISNGILVPVVSPNILVSLDAE